MACCSEKTGPSRVVRLEELEKREVLASPEVVSLSPSPNQIDAARDSVVEVLFDREITESDTADCQLVVHASKTSIPQLCQTMPLTSGNRLLLNGGTRLAPGERISATLKTGVVGKDASVTEAPLVWQFRTRTTGGSGLFNPTKAMIPGRVVASGDVDGDGDIDVISQLGPSRLVGILQ